MEFLENPVNAVGAGYLELRLLSLLIQIKDVGYAHKGPEDPPGNQVKLARMVKLDLLDLLDVLEMTADRDFQEIREVRVKLENLERLVNLENLDEMGSEE